MEALFYYDIGLSDGELSIKEGEEVYAYLGEPNLNLAGLVILSSGIVSVLSDNGLDNAWKERIKEAM